MNKLSRYRRWPAATLQLGVLLLCGASMLPSARAGLPPPPPGCAQRFCDPQLTSINPFAAVVGTGGQVKTVWSNSNWTAPANNSGCAVSGQWLTCNRAGAARSLVYVSADGVLNWAEHALNGSVTTVTPMSAVHETTSTYDRVGVASVDNGPGNTAYYMKFTQPFPSADRIWSANIVASTLILMTSGNGENFAMAASDGVPFATLFFEDTIDGDRDSFRAVGTPAVLNHLAYYVAKWPASSQARLFAVRVKDQLAGRMVAMWNVSCALPTLQPHGSPMVVANTSTDATVVFAAALADGQPVRAIAVRGNSTAGGLLWSSPPLPSALAGMAKDARQGFWLAFSASPLLWRLSAVDGSMMQAVNLTTQLGKPVTAVTSSLLLSSGSADAGGDSSGVHPVLLFGAMVDGKSTVVAWSAGSGKLLWTWPVPGGEVVRAGGISLARNSKGEARVVVALRSGLYGIA